MKKNLLIASVVAGIVLSSSALADTVTKKSTHWHSLTKFKKTAYTVSTDFVRAGDNSQKFELVSGACGRDEWGSDCKRNSERVERIYNKYQKPGKEYWYAWSIMLDSNTPWSMLEKSSVTLGQVKALGVHHPPWIFKMNDGQFYTNIHFIGDKPAGKIGKGDGEWCGYMGSTQMATGKWMDIVVKADYSDKLKQGHSYLQIWLNGELRCDIKEPIVNKHTWADRYKNKGKRINFRYGIYNNKVDRVSFMPTRTVWYDEIKIGTSLEDVQINTNNPVD
tara:strand:- start:7445 stop:8275 length:831 start_codon:yes stop_codon:yes gene_type:complete